MMLHQNFKQINIKFFLWRKIFRKPPVRNPPAFLPQTPSAGGKNQPRLCQKSFSPENSFGKTESALKPHALPEYLEGRTPKEKHPFLFQKNSTPAKSEMQGVFFFRGCWRTRQCVGLSPSVRGSFKPPRTRSVRSHYLTLFWK